MAGGWVSPDKSGWVNFRFLGARGYSPSWKWIRGYVDLNMGYTLGYVAGESSQYTFGGKTYKVETDDYTSHHFGLDFGVGIQLHKRFAIGYHMTYMTDYTVEIGEDKYKQYVPIGGTMHFCKLSVLF